MGRAWSTANCPRNHGPFDVLRRAVVLLDLPPDRRQADDFVVAEHSREAAVVVEGHLLGASPR